MKIITFFLLAVTSLFIVSQVSAQSRIFGTQGIDLDDNAHNHIYITNQNGSLGINGSNGLPNPCALLDLSSTTKGFLMPRMTTAQELALCGGVPPEGMLVYNTTTHTFDNFN